MRLRISRTTRKAAPPRATLDMRMNASAANPVTTFAGFAFREIPDTFVVCRRFAAFARFAVLRPDGTALPKAAAVNGWRGVIQKAGSRRFPPRFPPNTGNQITKQFRAKPTKPVPERTSGSHCMASLLY